MAGNESDPILSFFSFLQVFPSFPFPEMTKKASYPPRDPEVRGGDGGKS